MYIFVMGHLCLWKDVATVFVIKCTYGAVNGCAKSYTKIAIFLLSESRMIPSKSDPETQIEFLITNW